MISESMQRFLFRSGLFITVVAGCFQAGLLIGAETTPVQLLADVRTPGLVGPSVPVTPAYVAFWEAATAAAVVGLVLLVVSMLPQVLNQLAD